MKGSKNTIKSGDNNQIEGSVNLVDGHGNKLLANESTVQGNQN